MNRPHYGELFHSNGSTTAQPLSAEKQTRKCHHGYACLHSPAHKLCAVRHCVMHRVYFIECLDDHPCVFKSTLEGTATCTCPLRQELYERYGR